MAGRRILPYDKRHSRHVKYGIVIFLFLNCKYSERNLKCSNKGTKPQAFYTLMGAVKDLKFVQDSLNNLRSRAFSRVSKITCAMA